MTNLTVIDRDCSNCKHHVITDVRNDWNSEQPTYIWSCEKWECNFKPREVSNDENNERNI